MTSPDDDALRFAERLIALLDEGSFSATYKFAVLLGLMDLCFEHTNKVGEPPPVVYTPQLAEKIIELYWPHTRPYASDAQQRLVLRQNSGKRAKILTSIEDFRATTGDPGATLHKSRLAAPDAYRKLSRKVEWSLVSMPLPKLQRFGREEHRFIYDIAWDDDIKKGTWSDLERFDNRIHFVGGAAGHLVRLSALLRPLIQHKWAAMVGKLNQLEVAKLEGFLFGLGRSDLSPVRAGLRDVQSGDCFYCERPLRESGQVDHFLPWARHPDDGLDNLVVAHAACNNAKRDFLAATRHLRRWRERTATSDAALSQIAEEKKWPREPNRIFGSVRAMYLRLPDGVELWLGKDEFERAEHAAIREALQAV